MTKEFCDICERELIAGKHNDFSDKTPVSFDFGPTHCTYISRTEIFERVCKKCEIKIIKAMTDIACEIKLNKE